MYAIFIFSSNQSVLVVLANAGVPLNYINSVTKRIPCLN